MIRLAAVVRLLAIVSFAACASSSLPWFEDGVECGTIVVLAAEDGRIFEYRDRAGQTRRIEHRCDDGTLDARHVVEHRQDYDAHGLPHLVRFTDVAGRPAVGPGGYAVQRATRASGSDGTWLLHLDHFDAADKPVCVPAGYVRETATTAADGRVQRRQFFSDGGQRVSVEWPPCRGVHEVVYAYLQGTTEIVVETLLGEDGNPVHKRQISGLVVSRRDAWIYTR